MKEKLHGWCLSLEDKQHEGDYFLLCSNAYNDGAWVPHYQALDEDGVWQVIDFETRKRATEFKNEMRGDFSDNKNVKIIVSKLEYEV